MKRTEADDKERLLRIAQEHVKEQHGKDFTLDEIESVCVKEVEV